MTRRKSEVRVLAAVFFVLFVLLSLVCVATLGWSEATAVASGFFAVVLLVAFLFSAFGRRADPDIFFGPGPQGRNGLGLDNRPLHFDRDRRN